ncbi:MAG: peptidyl-prolyl cis-trans isomerase [Gemmatimonadetes bacterium]|nr:peptidyl-prolyl cis-trans isomerase [Gemmatimonadota bacterium]
MKKKSRYWGLYATLAHRRGVLYGRPIPARQGTHEGCPYIVFFVVVLAILIGCAEDDPAVATEDAVLVEVGPTAIRVADYRQFIVRVAPELRAEYGAEKLLEAIVEQTLLVQEAERRGLGESAEFLQWQGQAQAQLVQQALYKRAEIVQAEVAEEELRAYFQRSPYNRRVRFSLLMVRDQEQLPGILAAIAEGADFEELSMRHSQDSRILERQADMGYHRWGDTMASHAALTERAFSMQVGEISEPMQVADGYFLIKLTDMHPVSFEQERETIQRLVLREKLGRQLLAYYDTLHVRYNVRYGPDGLAAGRSSEEVVAAYDGGVLTVAQARELLKGQGAGEKVLRREVGRRVLVPLETARLALAADPSLQRELERLRQMKLARRLQDALQAQVPPPNPNGLSLFYEEHKLRYTAPAEVEVRRLLARDEAEGTAIVGRMRAGRDTTALADRFVNVIYGSGALEGDNPVSRALHADEGTFHGPFATDNGYIVLQVLRRRPDRLPPLDEIREQVEADWATAQLQAAVKELAASLHQRRANEIRFSPDAVALALLASSHGE